MREPILRPIVSLSGIMGVCYERRAPSYQSSRSSRASELRPGLRAFSTFSTSSSPQPIAQLAARQALWSRERAILNRLATHLGIAIRSGSSLFETVRQLIEGCLPGEGQDSILSIMRMRVASSDINCSRMNCLRSTRLWRCWNVLTKRGSTMSRDLAGAAGAGVRVQAGVPVEDSADPRDSGGGFGAGFEGKGECEGEGRPVVSKYPARVPRWPQATVSITEARALKPEGASLWRDVRHANWQGHYSPYARISRSWQKYGELQSLQLVLQNLWHWWCFERGLEDEDTPIGGIFGDAWVAPFSGATGASASSSSSRPHAAQ